MNLSSLSAALRLTALSGALLLGGACQSQAANITWGAATTISGDGNVQNTGTKVGAFTLGDTGVPSTVVNGVTFDAFAVPNNSTSASSGNFTLAFSNPTYAIPSNTRFGSTNAPAFGPPDGIFTDLSASYQTLLRSGVADSQNGTITLTMGGLTTGTNYSFQWWANDASSTFNYSGVTATSGNAVTLDPNIADIDGYVGQFATGTFRADSASQAVSFSGASGSYPFLNAFQLRVAPVPEPSTYAMMALGLGALALVTRRKRQSDLA